MMRTFAVVLFGLLIFGAGSAGAQALLIKNHTYRVAGVSDHLMIIIDFSDVAMTGTGHADATTIMLHAQPQAVPGRSSMRFDYSVSRGRYDCNTAGSMAMLDIMAYDHAGRELARHTYATPVATSAAPKSAGRAAWDAVCGGPDGLDAVGGPRTTLSEILRVWRVSLRSL